MKCLSTFASIAILFLVSQNSAFAGAYEEELNKLSTALATSLDNRHLKTVAIIGFRDLDGKETNLGKLLVEDISVDLVNQSAGVSIMDRDNLNKIMDEKKLTEEGLVQPDNAKQLKLSGIDAIIIGTIIPFEDTYRLDVKAIATDTAQLVVAKRVSITKTENLDVLMGIKPPEAPRAEPVGSTMPPPVAAIQPPVPKRQKTYDLGAARVDITSVELFRKGCKVRVNCVITNTGDVGYGSFAYHIVDKNAPREGPGIYNSPSSYNKPPDRHLVGDAVDDKGNSYSVLLPADADSAPRVDPGQSVNARIEYQVVSEDGSPIQVPQTVTFSFEFYMSFQDQAHLHRLSVSDYPFDRIH